MIYTGSAGVETTYYATPLFDVVHTSSLTDYRHYIFAGGRAVMQLSRSVDGAAQRPLLTDHQGSISTIMHGTGTSFVNESFTAYGNRREASTWTGNPTSAELTNMASITRQGYTFQTVLGTMHLNHMNGRVEDSFTGRFLSPDPLIPDPGNTQSYNRYGYVNNNPLTYVDPTGFYCGEPPATPAPDLLGLDYGGDPVDEAIVTASCVPQEGLNIPTPQIFVPPPVVPEIPSLPSGTENTATLMQLDDCMAAALEGVGTNP